ncbi:MAG: hypothetical protein IT537_31850 [Hyphomicrobiales bacterium]|nr:hypothetical protein [Hyphomicrobiales bacterium]
MPQILSGPSPSSLTRNWIRNSALIGVVHVAAVVLLYFVRAVLPSDSDELALITAGYLLVIAIGLLAGAAEGVLSGAVLQRIVRALPVRAWIALHAAVNAVIFAITGPFSPSSRDVAADATPISAVVLASVVLGGIVGALVGTFEALVLRNVAFGLALWIAYSALAGGVVYGAIAVFTLWRDATGSGDELAQLIMQLVLTVVQAVILLPALWQLRPRGRPQDVF